MREGETGGERAKARRTMETILRGLAASAHPPELKDVLFAQILGSATVLEGGRGGDVDLGLDVNQSHATPLTLF